MTRAPRRIPTFREELRDFLRFVRHPRFTPRLAPRAAGSGWWADWFPSLSIGSLVKWAAFLWAVNIFFLGPIAVMAAGAGGAAHKLNIYNIPWLQALLWAPIVEELVFRHGLRRLAQAVWVVPAAAAVLVTGPGWGTILLLAAILLLCWAPPLMRSPSGRRPLPWRLRLRYRRVFGWVFYGSSLLFAAVHLNNFSLAQTPYWLMPLLVLPQCLTGMVLGWLRVRRGIGASMLLHGIFNAGPLLVVWVVLHTVDLPV